MTYAEKLRDPRWQRKRLEILERDKWTCAICEDKESTLHVHHKHYRDGLDPWDYEDGNLTTLCERCHSDIKAHDEYQETSPLHPYVVLNGMWGLFFSTLLIDEGFLAASLDRLKAYQEAILPEGQERNSKDLEALEEATKKCRRIITGKVKSHCAFIGRNYTDPRARVSWVVYARSFDLV